MSAYVVSTDHIDALVTAGLEVIMPTYRPLRWRHGGRFYELTPETADRVAAMLLAENQRSVNHRYREDDPEPVHTYKRYTGRLYPLRVLKLINGYDYQACETPDWDDTEAHAYTQALQAMMIRELPGYADEPWEV